jgi:hypothetical protein
VGLLDKSKAGRIAKGFQKVEEHLRHGDTIKKQNSEFVTCGQHAPRPPFI